MNAWQLVNPVQDIANSSWIAVAFGLCVYAVVRAFAIQLPFLYWTQKSRSASRKRVYRLPLLPKQLLEESKNVGLNIFVDSIAVAIFSKTNPAPINESHILSTALFAFAWTEVWFYLSHRLMHTRMLYPIHRLHHEAKVATPLTGMSFSILERLSLISGIMVGLGAFALIHPMSYLGVACYFAFNYLFALVQHSNIEFFSPRMRRLFFWMTTPTHHSLHHARIRGHYGLYTPFLDRIFKTEFADYGKIQDLAFQGQGLTSLGRSSPRANRRVHMRHAFRYGVLVTHHMQILRGITADISSDSASIVVSAPLAIGASVNLKFSRTATRAEIKTQAIVVSIFPQGDGFRCGLRFLTLEPHTASRWAEDYIGSQAS